MSFDISQWQHSFFARVVCLNLQKKKILLVFVCDRNTV